MLKAIRGAFSSSHSHRAPAAQPGPSSSSQPQRSADRHASSVGGSILASSSNSVPPVATFPKVTTMTDAELKLSIRRTLDVEYLNDPEKLEIRTSMLAEALLRGKFIQVDGGKDAEEQMKDDIFDFFSQKDAALVVRFSHISELRDMKIVFNKGGCQKLLEFIDMHPEIKRCEYKEANCATYIIKQDEDEMFDFLDKLEQRNLLITI